MPPHPTFWRSILILSSHLCLHLPSGFFPSGFSTKTPYTPLLSPIRATCFVYLILLDFITRTILNVDYRSLSSSLCNFLHSPVTPALLGPNILLNTLFSNTLSLCSSLIVSDQFSHPYKTTGKVIVTTNPRCVKSHKSADLIYTPAGAWNYTTFVLHSALKSVGTMLSA